MVAGMDMAVDMDMAIITVTDTDLFMVKKDMLYHDVFKSEK